MPQTLAITSAQTPLVAEGRGSQLPESTLHIDDDSRYMVVSHTAPLPGPMSNLPSTLDSGTVTPSSSLRQSPVSPGSSDDITGQLRQLSVNKVATDGSRDEEPVGKYGQSGASRRIVEQLAMDNHRAKRDAAIRSFSAPPLDLEGEARRLSRDMAETNRSRDQEPVDQEPNDPPKIGDSTRQTVDRLMKHDRPNRGNSVRPVSAPPDGDYL